MEDDALPSASAPERVGEPKVGCHSVNGTTLYAEVRGAGPAVLLVHAGGEDAEVWRPVAERLTGATVVTYDRRLAAAAGRIGLDEALLSMRTMPRDSSDRSG